MIAKQASILDTAQTLVRKGGRLVYATCSLLEEENEAQVSAFLLRHPDFAIVPLAARLVIGDSSAEQWRVSCPLPRPGTAPTGSSPRCWSGARDLAAQSAGGRRDRHRRGARRGVAQHLSWDSARHVSGQVVGLAPGGLLRRGDPRRHRRDGRHRLRRRCAGGSGPRIIGFTTAGRARHAEIGGKRLAEGEVETLYVLDDWRERGVGRRLMRAAASHLVDIGCKSAFLWVLRDNPSRWFYQRLGGRPVAEATIQIGGEQVPQTAFVWDPIEQLLAASPQSS